MGLRQIKRIIIFVVLGLGFILNFSPPELEKDRWLFTAYCSACHGLDGRQGRANESLYFKAPTLNKLDQKIANNKDKIRKIIFEGNEKKGMPSFAKILNSEEIEKLAVYVQIISRGRRE